MEPGSQLLATGPTPSRLPQGQRRSARDGEPAPLVAVVAAADRNREARRHRTHLSQVDLELLGQGLELELAAAVRAARRRGASSFPVDRPGRCHAMAVATVGPRATPARLLPVLLRVAFENGRLALSERRAREQPLQLCDARLRRKARLTLGKRSFSSRSSRCMASRSRRSLSDLATKPCRVGFAARRSDARRIPNDTPPRGLALVDADLQSNLSGSEGPLTGLFVCRALPARHSRARWAGKRS